MVESAVGTVENSTSRGNRSLGDWASRGADIAVAWLCPAQIYVIYIVVDHAPTN